MRSAPQLSKSITCFIALPMYSRQGERDYDLECSTKEHTASEKKKKSLLKGKYVQTVRKKIILKKGKS